MKLLKSLLFIGAMLLPCFVHADDSVSGPGGTFVSQFLDEGVALTRRGKVNWTGAGVSCVDNSTLKRLDCTVTSSGSGSGTSTSLVIRYGGVLVSSPTGTINYLPPLIATLDGSTTAQISLSRISLSTGVVGSVDISTQTNLAVTAPLILTNDTLSISAISLSTGVVGPLNVSSGTITRAYTSTLTFSDGTTQTTAASAASGDITAVNAGTGLTGGGLVGSVTLAIDTTTSSFIHNQDTLQSGTTAYPGFLRVGTAGIVDFGPLNVEGVITASGTVITTVAGLLDATKLSGLVPNASLDSSSVTKQGNTFNTAGKLLQLDGSADVPDANLSGNVSLLGPSIDISAETNLAVQGPLILTDDTISIDSSTFVGGGGSMSPGASYYVNVDPLSAQSGAFNIASGTVAGGLNVSTLTSLGSADFIDAGAFIRRSQVSATIPFASANVSGGITTNKFRIFDVYNFGSLTGTFGFSAINGNGFYIGDSAGTVYHKLGTNGDATFGPSTALGSNVAFGEAIAVEKNIITTSQTLGATYYLVLGDATSGALAIDLPNLGGTGFGTLSNRIYRICKTDSSGNAITFTASGSADSIDSITLSTQYECVDFYGYSTNPSSSAGIWRAVGHSGQASAGGGGSSALEVRSVFTGVGSSPTASILIGDGITTAVSGSTTTLAADFTKILRSTTAATTYATQAIVIQSTAQLNSQFANYLTTGNANATFLPITVAATTYLTQSSATTTYPQISSITATYVQFSSAVANYLTLSSATANYLAKSSATATYLQLSSASAVYLPFARIVAGTNISLSPAAGALTISATGSGSGGSWVTPATSTLDMAGYGIVNVASISFVAPGGSYIDVGTNTAVNFVVNGTTWSMNQSSITFGGSAASLGSNILVSSFPATAVTAGSYTNTNLTVDAYGRITSASNGSGGSGGMYSFAISSNGVVVSSPAFNLSFTGPNLNVTVNGATNTVTYTSTVTTSGVPEGTNQYFTSARVNMALTNPTTIPFNVATSSVTPNPYGSGWNGSSRVVAEDAIYDKIESMSAGSGILATDTTTVSGSWTFLAPVEFRSTVTWTTTGGFDLQENSTFLMPRGMDVSSYTNKGSLSYNMTTNAVQVGTGTISRMIGGDVLQTFFASTGTYTPNPRMVTVKVTLTAPGGPTGSCTGTDSVVGGGGGGGTVVKTFTRAQIGASQAVNIPAAQAAGVAATVNATFGSFMTATSGGLASEGTAATVAISSIPGVGGGWTGGDYGIKGDDGTPGIIVTTAIGIGGNGGGSFQGGGTYGGRMDVVGRAGTGIGSGAGGCHAATATDRAGAAGGPGGAIIEEYLGG